MKIKSNVCCAAMLMLLFGFSKSTSAQFTVSASTNYSRLIDSLVASGVAVSNVSYSGSAASCGYFSNGGSTNLGAGSGIVLSTGFAADIDKGAAYNGSSNTGAAGNSLLQSLSGANISDAAVLEFDVVPTGDTLSFSCIYGSEDYPEWVGGNPLYQDYIGAFITGTNPSGGNYSNQNFVFVPGTLLPVIVNNINASTNAQYFVNNTSGSVMFDGFTTLLQIKIPVVASAKYHLVIAIGDGGDQISDAGIFLKSHSLMSNGISTGISTIDGNKLFKIYPNPSNNMLNVKCGLGYQIFSSTGELLMENNADSENIDISMLPAGLYLLKTDNKIGRFVKSD